MSLKNELLSWQNAVEKVEHREYAEAIKIFLDITDVGAKIHFNIGAVYMQLKRYEDAAISLTNAIHQDKYFAVAYFCRGVVQWILKDYVAAIESFTDCIEYLRENDKIDYNQLGLEYKLYSFEVFFNRSICFLAVGDVQSAASDLEESQKDEILSIHQNARYRPENVLKAYQEGKLDSYLPFVIPNHLLFEPPAIKMENIEEVDYLGKGKVVASLEKDDEYVGFTGPRKIAMFAAKPEDETVREGRVHTRTMSDESEYKQIEAQSSQTIPEVQDRRPSDEDPSIEITGGVKALAFDRLKVKCLYRNDRRMLIVPASIAFVDLQNKIMEKYSLNRSDISIKYKDEDGELVLMTDQEDLALALKELEIANKNKLNIYIDIE